MIPRWAAHGPIRQDVLWRADDVTVAPLAQLDSLRAAGLSTEMDLRSSQEIATTGPGHAPTLGLAVHHVPLSAASADPASVARSFREIRTPEQVGGWRAASIRDYAGALVGILRLVTQAPGRTLFHCAEGKDRARMTAAAVLSVLGTPEDDIVADYAPTHANMPGIKGRWGAEPVSPGVDRSLIPPLDHPLMGAHPEAMAATHTALDGTAGVVRMLRAAGLDAVVHLLSHTPVGAPVTIGAIVEASGTSRAAIYLRWPDQRALLVATLDPVRSDPPRPDSALSLCESLVAMYAAGVEQVDELQRTLISRRLVLGLQDPELQRQYWERHVSRRRVALIDRLRLAQVAGEVRCDADLEATVDLLNGMHYYQFVARGQWGGPGYAQRVSAAIAIVLRGIAA